MRPSVRHLEYAVAVAQTLNFREAAKRCHVTQPALSAQVAQLEELLGVQLFERDRRRVILTAAGAKVIARAKEVLKELDALVDAAHVSARPLSGTLRLGVIPTVAPYILPRAMAAIRAHYPDLRLWLREEQTEVLVRMIIEGRLDVLLLALEAELGDLHRHPLWTDPFWVAMPKGHPLARHKKIRQQDLRGQPVLLLDDGHCLRQQTWDVCQAAGAHELGDFRASSLHTLEQMTQSGIGITLLPEMALQANALGARLELRPFSRPVPQRTIGLCWRRTSGREDEFVALANTIMRCAPEPPRLGVSP